MPSLIKKLKYQNGVAAAYGSPKKNNYIKKEKNNEEEESRFQVFKISERP